MVSSINSEHRSKLNQLDGRVILAVIVISKTVTNDGIFARTTLPRLKEFMELSNIYIYMVDIRYAVGTAYHATQTRVVDRLFH